MSAGIRSGVNWIRLKVPPMLLARHLASRVLATPGTSSSSLGYPDKQEEIEILLRFQQEDPLQKLVSVVTIEDVSRMQRDRGNIIVSDPVRQYIVEIVRATRDHSAVQFGASPRGSLGLMRAGQALAALRGRDHTLPDDIKSLVIPILAHRLILMEQNQLRGESSKQVLEGIIDRIPVPAALA